MKNIIMIKVFIMLIIFIIGCGEKKINYSLKINALQKYGNNKDFIISFVNDFKFYKNNIYILDGDQKRIYISDINGNLIRNIQLKSGKGPGEFSNNPCAFEIICDSIFIIVDQSAREIEFINKVGKHILTIETDYIPHDIFLKDDLIYISGNSKDKIIWKYDYKGKKIDGIITPFNIENLPVNWISEIVLDDEGNFYITNPYDAVIIKWNEKILWKFSYSDKKIIEIPNLKGKGKRFAMYQTSGWVTNGQFFVDKYLIAFTFSVGDKKKKPHYFVIDKNSGKLLFHKEVEKFISAKSFNKGENIFSFYNEPFPHLEQVSINIFKE